MDKEESLQSKSLRSEAFWDIDYGRGLRSSSWPECGALPTDYSPVFPNSHFETVDEIDEEVGTVDIFIEGQLHSLYRDEASGESLADFRARVAIVLGETALPPALEES